MSGAAARMQDDEDDIPLRPASGNGRQHDSAEEPEERDPQQPLGNRFGEYVIVDTDDQLRPLKEEREGSLSEDEEGDETFLERRRAGERSGQDHAEERRASSPEQRANTRRSSRQRARDARDRNIAYTRDLEKQLQDLREQVSGIAPRLDAHDHARMSDYIAGLGGNIETQQAIATAARAALISAMENGDHQGVADAMDRRDAAVREEARLSGLKEKAEADFQRARAADDSGDGRAVRHERGQPTDQRQSTTRQRLSPEASALSEDFFARHPWIDRTNLRDPETVELLALDRLVASRGIRPESQAYWDAVEDEMRRSPVLAYRLDDDDEDTRPSRQRGREHNGRSQQQPPARRGPMVGGGGERNGQQREASGGRVYLSPARREALIAAGVMDARGTIVDETKFKRTLKSYQDFDRENPPSRS